MTTNEEQKQTDNNTITENQECAKSNQRTHDAKLIMFFA